MRDVSRQLWKHGYALAALASHDAQSIGGLIATNVHGTGAKLDAFVSEQVVRYAGGGRPGATPTPWSPTTTCSAPRSAGSAPPA